MPELLQQQTNIIAATKGALFSFLSRIKKSLHQQQQQQQHTLFWLVLWFLHACTINNNVVCAFRTFGAATC
jgi:hypothetical protein